VKVSLEILSSDSSLDASDHVVLIDPYNLVHSAHVETNHHSLILDMILILEIKSLRHISTATIWNDYNVMRIGKLNNFLYLLGAAWVDYNVNVSFEFTVSEVENFSETCSVRMHDSFPLFKGPSRKAFLFLELLQKLMMHIWRIDVHILLWFLWGVKSEANFLLNPWVKLGHVLARVHILVSLEKDLHLLGI
jgi:hypothetical protein